MNFKETSNDFGENFLKLKSDESVQGVFRGDPYDFKLHWNNKVSTVCLENEGCPLCKEGNKASFRFRLNFITKQDGEYISKVFEQGWKTYKALRVLHKDYDLEKHVVKVTRHGSGTDTIYSIIPMPNGLLTAETDHALAKVKLHSLKPDEQNQELGDDNHHSGTYEDIPF